MAPRAYLVCHAMRIKGILEGKTFEVFIAGIIRGFNGVVWLSYLLPVLLQPLKIVFATLVV